MKTSLLIMAAGIGSRFGGGIKQLEPVGLNNEIIMDYSIHDAIEAGFNKIIFVIRKDIEEDFRCCIGNRIEEICRKLNIETAYAFQDLNNIPEGYQVPEGRKKPWGTGQAVLSASDLIREPFAVINADDYYGKEAFVKIHDYLTSPHSAYCMAGFQLKNTLSDNGGVTRGICEVSEGMLTNVVETHNIVKSPMGPVSEGTILDPDSLVSMNMWGFPSEPNRCPEYLDYLVSGFNEFFDKDVRVNPLKAEYLLPIHIGSLLTNGKIQVQVLKSSDRWFGVTYREDRDFVVDGFRRLIESGVYPQSLYSDLI